MKNYYGDYLFPQQEDPEKWQKAADAAYEVIKMNKYSLVQDNSVVANGTTITDEDAKFLNAMRSYQLVWQNDGTWSNETIWGWWWRTSSISTNDTSGYDYLGGVGGTMVPALPPNFGFYAGFGGSAPSLKLIDTYPMWKTGRYPVTGYQGVNDMSKPIIDPQSGYVAEGFTDNYKQYVDPIYPEWRPTIKAHNSCIGRDPRYYANVVPNGFYWPHQAQNKEVHLLQHRGYLALERIGQLHPRGLRLASCLSGRLLVRFEHYVYSASEHQVDLPGLPYGGDLPELRRGLQREAAA